MIWTSAAVFAAATALAAGLVSWSGAWQADLSLYPDEPGHFVTALAVHDYLRHGLATSESPVQYFRDYYHSFPRVALGHWPPLFHILLAIVPFAISTTVTAALAFQTMITGASAAVLCLWLQRDAPAGVAPLFSLLLPLLPLVAQYTRSTMAEPLLMFWVAAAGLALTRYLEAPSPARLLAYGGLTVACLLTKANGALLLLALPLALGLSGRWELLRSRVMIILALAMAAAVLLWLALFWRGGEGWAGTTDVWWLVTEMAPGNWRSLGMVGGWVLVGLAMTGILPMAVEPVASAAISGGAIILAALIFHSFLVPTGETRHLIVAAAPLLVLAAQGLVALARRLRFAWITLAVPASLIIAAGVLPLAPKADLGAGAAARLALSRGPGSTGLVEGEAEFAGTVIGAFAALGQPPGGRATVYRHDKLPHFSELNAEQMDDLLQSIGIEWVAVQTHHQRTSTPHGRLPALLDQLPERWQRASNDPSAAVYLRRNQRSNIPRRILLQEPGRRE